MTNIKKIIAGASAISLLAMNAMNFTASAAAITSITANGGTTLAANAQITTVVFTPITAITNGSEFTFSYPAAIDDTGLVSGDITPSSAGGVYGAAVVDTAANTVRVPVTTGDGVNNITLTFANSHFAAPASGNIALSINTSVGDVGSVMIYVANANVVNVTATVAPILSMALSNNTSASFGTLIPGTPKAAGTAATPDTPATTNVTIATNATSGYSLSTTATTMTDPITSDTLANAGNTTDLSGGATEGYGINVTSNANGATIAAGYDDTASAATADTVSTATAANLASKNTTTAGDVIGITYWLNVTPTTAAGNYAGTVTYTITGSF